MFAQRMTLQEHDTNNTTLINMKANVFLHYNTAKNIPVFCMFTVYDSDCFQDNMGKYSICLSKETKAIIRKHFPAADTVAIIDDPQQFVQDVNNSIGCRIVTGQVQYFNIDKGFETSDGSIALDLEYMKFLAQDSPPIKEGSTLTYAFRSEYVYRALFAMDVFFKQEQEYRIVLPNESISKCKHYPITLSLCIKTMPLDLFME